MATSRVCSIPGCGKKHVANGHCRLHYNRTYNNGDIHLRKLENGAGMAFVEEALLSDTDDCIIWPYGKYPGGYAKLFIPERKCADGAHRYVCARAHGEGEAGHVARHSCHNRACINPRHLSWGTQLENIHDSLRDGRILTGEKSPSAVLTDALVREIRIAVGTDKAVADRFGVAQSVINNVRNRKTWAHVE